MEFVSSILLLQGGSESLGVGGGGEHMLLQDIQLIRTEMIGRLEAVYEYI